VITTIPARLLGAIAPDGTQTLTTALVPAASQDCRHSAASQVCPNAAAAAFAGVRSIAYAFASAPRLIKVCVA